MMQVLGSGFDDLETQFHKWGESLPTNTKRDVGGTRHTHTHPALFILELCGQPANTRGKQKSLDPSFLRRGVSRSLSVWMWPRCKLKPDSWIQDCYEYPLTWVSRRVGFAISSRSSSLVLGTHAQKRHSFVITTESHSSLALPRRNVYDMRHDINLALLPWSNTWRSATSPLVEKALAERLKERDASWHLSR